MRSLVLVLVLALGPGLVALAGCEPSAREADCKQLQLERGEPRRTWSYEKPPDYRSMRWRDPEIAKLVAELNSSPDGTDIVGQGTRYDVAGSNRLVARSDPRARLAALCASTRR